MSCGTTRLRIGDRVGSNVQRLVVRRCNDILDLLLGDLAPIGYSRIHNIVTILQVIEPHRMANLVRYDLAILVWITTHLDLELAAAFYGTSYRALTSGHSNSARVHSYGLPVDRVADNACLHLIPTDLARVRFLHRLVHVFPLLVRRRPLRLINYGLLNPNHGPIYYYGSGRSVPTRILVQERIVAIPHVGLLRHGVAYDSAKGVRGCPVPENRIVCARALEDVDAVRDAGRTGLRDRVVRAGAAAQLDDGICQPADLDVVERAGTVGREQRSVPVSVQLLVGHRAAPVVARAYVRFLREQVAHICRETAGSFHL